MGPVYGRGRLLLGLQGWLSLTCLRKGLMLLA